MRRETRNQEVPPQIRSELEHYYRHAESQSDELQQSQAGFALFLE